MSPLPIRGLTLDTGALLALDQPSKAVEMQRRIETTHRRGGALSIPTETIAQAWRGSRQARLARLLKSPDVEIVPMTFEAARAVGLLCGRSNHADVVDVHVALCAHERHHAVVTSDPDDIARVDPKLPTIRI